LLNISSFLGGNQLDPDFFSERLRCLVKRAQRYRGIGAVKQSLSRTDLHLERPVRRPPHERFKYPVEKLSRLQDAMR
jgi:hypothetical protein